MTFSNFVKRLRVATSITSPEFFTVYWRYLYQRGRTRIYEKRTTGIRNFKLNDFLENERILLPPLDEQNAIVVCLQAVTRAREATEAVIAAARELKRSLLRHLFTYGPVPVEDADRVELKETEIGRMPEYWTYANLGTFARTTSGGTPSRERADYFGGGIPWVKSGELGDGVIVSTGETLSPLGLAESAAKMFPVGTLLVAMYGATAGKVGLLRIPSSTNQAVCAIFPDQSVADQTFLFYALVSRRDYLLRARYGGAQPNISQTVLQNFPLPLPPISEL